MANENLRIMLWNVENLFIYLDSYNGEDLSKLQEGQWQSLSNASTPNKYLNKVFGLKKTIDEIKPDILMLNEVGGIESIENFNSLFLDSQYTAHLLEGNSDRGIDVGYLVKKELSFDAKLFTHKHRPIDLKYDNDPDDVKYYISRDVAELQLQINNKPQFVFLLTHLKSKLDPQGIDKEGIIRRTAEAKLLTDIYLERQKELPNIPIFVCGDFNGILEDPRHTEFQYLRDESKLVDTLEYSKIFKTEPRTTQVQFRMNLRTDYQFDYILFNPKFSNLIIPEESFIYYYTDDNGKPMMIPNTLTERFKLASDHYPVVVTLCCD